MDEVIEQYPDDEPYPSRWVLGRPAGQPVHVVAADDPESGVTFVITVYGRRNQWHPAFRTRRK